VLNLFVCAESRDCLSGFHVSNIAAAMSTRRMSVRVFELSGLLPNVAYYFSHRPAVYLKPLIGPVVQPIPGASGITIAFDSAGLGTVHYADDGVCLNLVHLPTLDRADDPHAPMVALREQCLGERWVIHLTRDAGRQTQFRETLGAAATFTLLLPSAGRSVPMTVPGESLGSIRGWEARVGDRLPVVLRNRDSKLARDYLAVCESVLVRIHSLRRRREIEERDRLPRLRATRR
jgi:hypothetical protein